MVRDSVLMPMIARLEFCLCGGCDHEIALSKSAPIHGWVHHITRSELFHIPHWPMGHILTTRCMREPCRCVSPKPAPGLPLRSRLAYLGTNTDPLPQSHE